MPDCCFEEMLSSNSTKKKVRGQNSQRLRPIEQICLNTLFYKGLENQQIYMYINWTDKQADLDNS